MGEREGGGKREEERLWGSAEMRVSSSLDVRLEVVVEGS